jgi:transketolase C-terminal domain/subunit
VDREKQSKKLYQVRGDYARTKQLIELANAVNTQPYDITVVETHAVPFVDGVSFNGEVVAIRDVNQFLTSVAAHATQHFVFIACYNNTQHTAESGGYADTKTPKASSNVDGPDNSWFRFIPFKYTKFLEDPGRRGHWIPVLGDKMFVPR